MQIIRPDQPPLSWVPLRAAPLVFHRGWEPGLLKPVVTKSWTYWPATYAEAADERAGELLYSNFLKYRGLSVSCSGIRLEFEIHHSLVDDEPVADWYDGSLHGHPLEPLDRLNVRGGEINSMDVHVPTAAEELFIQAREAVWETLVGEFYEKICDASCHVLARVRSRFEPHFTLIPPDKLDGFAFDWSKGVATAPDGDRLYDVHVAPSGEVDEVELASPAESAPSARKKGGRPPIKLKRAMEAILAIPERDELSIDELHRRVEKLCEGRPKTEWPSKETVKDAREILNWCKGQGDSMTEVPGDETIKDARETLRRRGRK